MKYFAKRVWTLVAISSLSLAGCNKKEEQTEPVAEIPTATAPKAGSAAEPKPAVNREQPSPEQAVQANQIVGTVHEFMTQQLRIFIQQKGRMPQTFAEFAGARMDSVPRLPPGLHWEIDQSTGEVKAVRD
jgi:hypothetical protein